ncbi:MAG: hypothetical protein JO164_10025, partial [Candidatus Eremiobacteraeota bacterium]|nr:hypothetical protein [Candidatus Eremiobacteraeota bacterium]
MAIVATVVIGGAIAAYFAVRPVVAAVLARRFGCEVTVERVDLAGTTLRAHGVHAARCAQPLDIAVDVADLTSDGLSLRAAQVTLGIAGAAPVALAHVDGAVTRRDGRARFDLRFLLPTDAGPLPVALHGEQERDGIDVALRAKTLPVTALAPFAALVGSLVPEGGTLDDLDLHLRSKGASLDGGFALRDGAFAFGRHHLRGLTGTVALHDGALTADALVGTLDDAPVSFRGTMHAVPSANGESDALALGDLVSKLADATIDDSDLGPLRGATFEALGPGLLYADASMTTAVGPRVIHVIATDPREPSIKLDTALAHDSLVSGGLQTSTLAKASGAVAGVNGDYFDIGRTYQPQGMYAHGGELLRSPTERAVLTIRKDGRIAVGTYAFH